MAALLDSAWREQLAREGVELPNTVISDGDEPPCPACGCALPLVEGACADCGLQLT
ncbi:MAG: hypothetical protein AB7T06_05640 [Kofleriaceae bacterium]